MQNDINRGVMRQEKKVEKLERLLEPTVTRMGYELWGIQYRARRFEAKLCVYIDSSDGVSVDDCEIVSRQVSGVLDIEAPFGHAYTLEVSSPGIDRILFKRCQYEKNIGEVVDVRMHYPVEGSKRLRGVLTGIEDGELIITVDDFEYLVPIDQVKIARVIPNLS